MKSEIQVMFAGVFSRRENRGPSFLGLEPDSGKMVGCITRRKVVDGVKKIEMVVAKEKLFLLKMQSLIGSLNFCWPEIIHYRPFCKIINSICGLTKPHHQLRVNKSI